MEQIELNKIEMAIASCTIPILFEKANRSDSFIDNIVDQVGVFWELLVLVVAVSLLVISHSFPLCSFLSFYFFLGIGLS